MPNARAVWGTPKPAPEARPVSPGPAPNTLRKSSRQDETAIRPSKSTRMPQVLDVLGALLHHGLCCHDTKCTHAARQHVGSVLCVMRNWQRYVFLEDSALLGYQSGYVEPRWNIRGPKTGYKYDTRQARCALFESYLYPYSGPL